eukprot:COSAG02_NODE_7314_length_3069_cov_2.031650_2_plen_32_part_00
MLAIILAVLLSPYFQESFADTGHTAIFMQNK